MKAKNLILALAMALISTAASPAQEGESTKEGVPVVDEIVMDDTTKASNANVQRTRNVGSWSVTYTGDSISSEDIDDFEDTLEELFKEHEGFQNVIGGLAGIGAATGGLLIAGLVLFFIFGLPILGIILIVWLIVRAFRRDSADTRQTVVSNSADDPARDRTLFNKGIRNICLGVGLAVLFGIWMGDFGVGIGVLFVCIGIGELLVDYFAKK